MSLLDDVLPEPTIKPDCAPSDFFTRLERIATDMGWEFERRKNYAGQGDSSYDLLNVEVGNSERNLIARLTTNPGLHSRVGLDVVTSWHSYPQRYDEYVDALRRAFKPLFDEYKARFHKGFRLAVGEPPPPWDRSKINCERLSYAQGRLRDALRGMATGADDVRWRLRDAYLSIHTISPADLPEPLRPHLSDLFSRLTSRDERYSGEGKLNATVAQMTKATGTKLAERLLAIADAIDELLDECRERRS